MLDSNKTIPPIALKNEERRSRQQRRDLVKANSKQNLTSNYTQNKSGYKTKQTADHYPKIANVYKPLYNKSRN